MRIAILLILAVVMQAAGNLCLSVGMKRIAAFASVHPDHWQATALAATAQPLNWLGVLFLVGFFILFVTALSRSDLTLAMPIVSVEIVLNVALAHIILHEDVSPQRWAGVFLVASGVALVSLSARQRAASLARTEP